MSTSKSPTIIRIARRRTGLYAFYNIDEHHTGDWAAGYARRAAPCRGRRGIFANTARLSNRKDLRFINLAPSAITSASRAPGAKRGTNQPG
jgi:hypothetical protein